MPVPPALPPLEREVMERVWERGTTPARAVLDDLNADPSHAPRAYTTILTILRRLELKGLVTRERSARSDLYAPAIERDAYLRDRADAEIDDVIAAYGEHALAQFVRHAEGLDPERRAALRRLAGE